MSPHLSKLDRDLEVYRTGYGITKHPSGELVSWARPKVGYVRVSPTGRVHRVRYVIIRWNFMGGTRERPQMSVVLACSQQYGLRQVIAVTTSQHHLDASGPYCARCARADIRDLMRDPRRAD